MVISPESKRSVLFINFKSVDFPHPFFPTIAILSPSFTVKDKLSRSLPNPKDLQTLLHLILTY